MQTTTQTNVTIDDIAAWIRRFGSAIAEHKTELTDLDAAIGDGDHGINMDRGMSEVTAKLAAFAAQAEISALLRSVGMTLLSKVGGASGPLYGTFFLRFAMQAANKPSLTADDFLEGLRAGLVGIQQRGSAVLGEKTMVDALAPAVATLDAALAHGDGLPAAIAAAAAGANAGAAATIPMQATKGRASYLGPRSVGHQDPGATSMALLLTAAAAALHSERSA